MRRASQPDRSPLSLLNNERERFRMLCKVETPQGGGCVDAKGRSSRRLVWLWPLAFLGIIILVLVSLFLPQGEAAPAPAVAGLTAQVGASLPVAPPNISQQEVLRALVRYGSRPEGPTVATFPGVDVLLATPTYFSFTGRQPPSSAAEQPSIIFYVSESVHVDDLPATLPRPLLKVGNISRGPKEVTALTDSPHHRTTLVRYEAAWSDGTPIVSAEARSLEMIFPTASGSELPGSALSWELPISYGPTYSSREVALDSIPQALSASSADSHSDHVAGSHEHRINPASIPLLGGSPLGLLALPALLGVILAALTPCLIDLSVYYGAYLGTTGAAAGASGASPTRSSLIKSSLFFILGLTIVYTTGGALAGQAGQLLQRLGLVLEWSRPLTIVAGVVVILVALRMAAQLRVPLLCRLPILAPSKSSASGPWRSTLMGSTFAAQCFSCFSGTIISALILYSGTSGSPLTGALLMLALSLGMGAMLLLSVILTTSFPPFTFGLKRLRPHLGLASALLMLGIGVTIILDKEHILSDAVLRVFGVG